MEQQQEIFQVTVQINPGLEPTTFSITIEENTTATRQQETVFKLSREKEKETIALLRRDTDHCWQQLSGNLEKDEIDGIGAAIDAHYA